MKIIIPMAGKGKRLRPHTLTVPKPLIPIAGKSIVHRLVTDLAKMADEKIEEISFIIGDFGEEAEKNLINIANEVGAEGKIYYQNDPLGTAHAILCAEPDLDGHLIVAFADTLFYADFVVNTDQDAIIWTNKIPDPTAFGVVETNENGEVIKLWEKPQTFVSDEAIIGIYYFKDGARLKKELKYLIDNDIKVKGEYQLTDALTNLVNDGAKIKTASVTHWLDCGNKDATLDTNKVVLEMSAESELISKESELINTVIIPPCFIDKNVIIENSVIGPYCSIGAGSKISNSIIESSILMQSAKVKSSVITHGMIGNFAKMERKAEQPNLGDYSELK